MKNKLVSLILALCIILSAAPTFAAFNDIAGLKSEYDIRVLEGIGIVEPGDSYRPESYITRGDFFLMTARIMGYKAETPEAAVSYLASAGVISGYGNGEFKCDSAITYNEALKMLVVALGYGQNASLQGGWPTGYVTVASNLDVTEAADKISGDSYITRGMAATLLVRAGNTRTAQVTYRDGNTILGPTGGKTLFKESLGVSKISGIINANSATSLTEPTGISLNEVRIGTDYIDAGNTNAKEYLGYYVDAYCVEDAIYKAMAVVPAKKKNNVLRLSSDSQITATGAYPSQIEISYYTNDGKQKRVKAEDCDVIYNGSAYLGFTFTDISIDSGEVILLDNNADGVYDVIFINEYETYIVKSVDRTSQKVYDFYGRGPLNLDIDSDQIQIIGSTGTLANFDYINAGDILSVQKSRNGEVVKVQIVKKSVSGIITAIESATGNTKLTIGDSAYYVSKDFQSVVHADKIEPYTGLEAVFYLDAEGKIAHISTSASDRWEYGYILSANEGDDDGKIYFRLYTENNKFERFEVHEKVNVDGVKKKVSAVTQVDRDTWMTRQLIRYQADGNIITKIDTAEAGYKDTTDSLKAIYDIDNAKYASTPKLFYNGNQTVLGGTDKTIVFTIPASPSRFADEMYYTVGGMSWFSNESTYNNLDAFNVNEAGVAEVIVRNQDDGVGIGSSHSSFMFVESISVGLNKEGEVVQILNGLRQNGSAATLMTDKNGVIDTSQIGLGDVVRIREKNGAVVYVEKTVDFKNNYIDLFAYSSTTGIVGGVTTAGSSYYEALKIACGYMTYADATHVVLSNADESKKTTFFLGTAPIMLCDNEEEKIKSISAGDLNTYIKDVNSNAKIYVITRNGSVTAVMVRVV